MNNNTEKELKRFIRLKRHEKLLELTMILEEIETEYNIDIEEFDFKDNIIKVRVGENDWVMVNVRK